MKRPAADLLFIVLLMYGSIPLGPSDGNASDNYYEIWRSTQNTLASATRIGEWLTSTSYTDTSVAPNQPYYYWVRGIEAETVTSGRFTDVLYSQELSFTCPTAVRQGGSIPVRASVKLGGGIFGAHTGPLKNKIVTAGPNGTLAAWDEANISTSIGRYYEEEWTEDVTVTDSDLTGHANVLYEAKYLEVSGYPFMPSPSPWISTPTVRVDVRDYSEPAPTGLFVVRDNTDIRLTWDSSSGNTGYSLSPGIPSEVPPKADPIDPIDPPIHTSQYNFVLGADPYFQWNGVTVGLDFSLSIPTLDPITYNPSITYPETPITPEISPWETRFSTNNKLLGEGLSLIAPVDINAIELTGTARLSGDVDAIAGVGLADGDTQGNFEARLGAGVNLGISLTATNSLFEALPAKLQALIPNTFEFTYPILGGNIGVDDVKIDHGLGSFDMQFFREALVAIPDDEYTSVDQLVGAVNIGHVPMIFSDTDADDVIDHVLASVGAKLSVYAETSATAGVDVYFYEVDENDNQVESTSIFTSMANLWNKGIDLLDEIVISSETGIVNIDVDGLQLQTGSPVWTQTVIALEEETNLLAFSAEFLSEEGAEGILQIFCNGELVATVDERIAVEGAEEYIFSLPEELEAGDCLLAFRLDPFTDVASNIQIDNITMGYMQAVPEPHPGDANRDNTTDLSDFNIWNANKFTAPTDWHRGDFDGNGGTDLTDFNIWNANKFTVANGGAAPAPTEVPEPGVVWLLAGGLLGIGVGRWWRGQSA